MRQRRLYWFRGESIDLAHKSYESRELTLFLKLSRSFGRLGINERIGFRVVWNLYYKRWSDLVVNMDIKAYYSLLSLVRGRLTIQSSPIKSSTVFSKMEALKTNLLFSINSFTMQSNVFRQNVFTSYYLTSFFDIHFIRVQRRYNKRRYGRVRAVSRPSFWLGNLISCLLVGMF